MSRGTTLAVLLGMLLLWASAYAQVDIVGGITYNTYAVDWSGVDEFKSGPGFFGGVQYWINDHVGVGGQVEYLSTTEAHDTSSSARLTSLSFLATAVYHASFSDTIFVRPFVGMGVYTSALHVESGATTVSFEAAPAFGAKLGVQVGTDISSKVSLTGLVGYRVVAPFREKETNQKVDGLNFSGLTIGGGVGYRF